MTPFTFDAAHAQHASFFRTLRGTVLLVDDDEASLTSLARGLLGSDFRVVRAQGAQAALQALAREPVDVLVTELELEGMGGLELLDRARQRRPEAVRIILTGHPDVTSAISAINCEEVFRYLTKPVNRDQLLATLQLALARRWRDAAGHGTAAASAPSRAAPPRRQTLAPEEQLALRAACRGFLPARPQPLLLAAASP